MGALSPIQNHILSSESPPKSFRLIYNEMAQKSKIVLKKSKFSYGSLLKVLRGPFLSLKKLKVILWDLTSKIWRARFFIQVLIFLSFPNKVNTL
jgi:hypothetical protein